MTDPQDDVERLAEYLSDDDAPESRDRMARWLADDSARAELAGQLDRARTALRRQGAAEMTVEVASLRNSIEAWAARHSNQPVGVGTSNAAEGARRGADTVASSSSAHERFRVTRPHARWHRPIAAGVMAVLVAAVAVVVVRRPGPSGTPAGGDTMERVYATVSGQQATVTLHDGSRVTLGPSTTLRVGQTDAQTAVTVQGQALFHVAHHSDRPFVVRTGRSFTRVLGTTFLVRQYTADHATRVVVVDGRVSVRGVRGNNGNNRIGTTTADPQAVLTANTSAEVNDSGQVIVTPNVVVDDYTGWTNGVLQFHNTPARDVITDLGRTYGVDIQLADSTLASHPLTWTVSVATQSLTDVLDGLATILDAHVVRDGTSITLKPGRTTVRKSTPRHMPSHLLTLEPQYGK